MTIHIAIVGSTTFVETVSHAAPKFDDVRFSHFTYAHPREAADIATQLGSFDGVFFSGSFPYAYASPFLNETIAHHVVQDETVLLTTVLYATLTQKLALDEVTIDVNEPERLHTIFTSFTDLTQPAVMKIHPDVDFSDVFRFHASHQQRDTNLAVTSIERVHRQLLEEGFNSQLMIEPVSTVIRHLEKLIDQVRRHLADLSQFAVVLYASTSASLHEYLRTMRHQGHVEIQDDTILLLTTKGEIVHALEEATLSPRDDDSLIGIGYGTDYKTAFEHARIALSASTEQQLRIVDAAKRLSFPASGETVQYRVTDEIAFDMVKRIGISPVNVGKILGFSKRKHEFTAKELTDYLGVSRRTTERLIKKLHDGGFVDVIGEEMSYAQGRPRAVYIFKLPS